jgi:hypothetical protein
MPYCHRLDRFSYLQKTEKKQFRKTMQMKEKVIEKNNLQMIEKNSYFT